MEWNSKRRQRNWIHKKPLIFVCLSSTIRDTSVKDDYQKSRKLAFVDWVHNIHIDNHIVWFKIHLSNLAPL